MNDFGPAAANSATIINIDLTIVSMMKPTIRQRERKSGFTSSC